MDPSQGTQDGTDQYLKSSSPALLLNHAMSELSVADRLATLAYTVDETPHIVVDGAKCRDCAPHPCLGFCPAQCFTPNDSGDGGGIDYYYAGCVECGTCLIMCNRDAVQWSYPRGGYGIVYRF